MATNTDPATELALIASNLSQATDSPGDRHLARAFGVEPWSTEFVKIIACIYERADLVEEIAGSSDLDEATALQCRRDVATFRSAFAGEALYEAWNTAPRGGVAKIAAGKQLAYLQGTVRQRVAYPKLTDAEVAELIGLIDAYLGALDENPDELPLVRQAIIDGLTKFRFQLRWIGWMGAGYSLVAFRDVVWAYEQSNQKYAASGNTTSDPAKALGGLFEIVKSYADKVKTAKGYADTAMWAYGGFQLTKGLVMPHLAAAQVPLLSG